MRAIRGRKSKFCQSPVHVTEGVKHPPPDCLTAACSLTPSKDDARIVECLSRPRVAWDPLVMAMKQCPVLRVGE